MHLTKDEKSDNEPPSTSFREIAREQHIPMESGIYEPQSDINESKRKLHPNNRDWENTDESDGSREDNESSRSNSIPSEAGVYTEGGLVYVPESEDKKERK